MKAVLQLTRDQRGFTLVELLVVIAVLGLMLAGLLSVQMQGQQAYLIGSHRVEAQQNARIALELMARELRSAVRIVTLGSATDITFVVCRDDPALLPIPLPCINQVTVRYNLAGTTLNRTEAGVTVPLIGGVQALALTYLRYNPVANTSAPTATPALVTFIRLQLVTGTEESVASYSASNQRATVEMMVFLRNSS